MRNEMNPTTHPSPSSHATQRNNKRPSPITQNQSINITFKKNQVMNDLPFVRVVVRLHTHVVGYLVAEASSLDRRVELYAEWTFYHCIDQIVSYVGGSDDSMDEHWPG